MRSFTSGCIGPRGAADVYTVELEKLALDVYLVRRPEPLREPVEPNAVFVVNAGDVVVSRCMSFRVRTH